MKTPLLRILRRLLRNCSQAARPTIALAAGLAAAATSPVSAETLSAGEPVGRGTQFASYLVKGAGILGLRHAGVDMDEKVGFTCDYKKDAKNLRIAIKGIEVHRDIALDKDAKHPKEGMWLVRYAFTRCGETALYNTMFKARADKSPRMLNLLPGHSSLHPKLMGEIGRELLKQVRKEYLKIECNSFRIVDTAAPSEKAGKSEDISEVWSVMACEEPVNYTIKVTPKEGTPDKADYTITRLGEIGNKEIKK